MSTDDTERRRLWLVQEPTYASSPTPPPNTEGEYLVCWRRPHWPHDRRDGRRMFHTYAKANEFRTKLEQGERQPHAIPTDTVFVAIHWRPCREWREIA